MQAKAWKNRITSAIKIARDYARENTESAYTSAKHWGAYHMLQIAAPRYIGSTSLIVYERRPEDIVVVANSGSRVEFEEIIGQVRERIDGEKIVTTMDNVHRWLDLSSDTSALDKLKGDVWFDSCLPDREMFDKIARAAKRNRAATPMVICTGFLLRFQD